MLADEDIEASEGFVFENIESSVVSDLAEFYVEQIIGYTCNGKNPKKWKFRIHWGGYEPEDDTMVDWAAVKDLDDYSKENMNTLI